MLGSELTGLESSVYLPITYYLYFGMNLANIGL